MNEYGVCTTKDEVFGNNVREYIRLQDEGVYIATLKFRSWGKLTNLGCYFETDDGFKFYLYAWRRQAGERAGFYCPRDSWPAFEKVEDGTRWQIEVKKTKNGKPFWATAERV